MNKKKKSRRKRILIAYAVRGAVVLVIAIMLFLMFCGCLYIRDFFRKKSESNMQTVYAAQPDNLQDNSGKGQLPEEGGAEDGLTVILDAGHGGNDGGTTYGNLNEKDITIMFVQQLKEKLEKEGIRVILTREDDTYLSLEQRAAAANSSSADVFVSLHCNYYEDDSKISGLECYHLEGSEKSGAFAQSIVDAISENPAIDCRGTRTENFFVLKKTNIPAVLIELGYLSNKGDRQNLQSADYQDVLTDRIAAGILAGLQNKG